MIMKVIYSVWIALFFVSPLGGMVVPVFAQDEPANAADIVAKMQSKLNLTQDQVAAVSPIIGEYSSKRRDLRKSIEDGIADKESIRSQMKQLKQDERRDLAQVLSSDQISQWNKMQSQGRHKRGSGGGGDGAGEGGGQ
jgi:septal ring factor EnvC (AmiA/AmiB activator)